MHHFIETVFQWVVFATALLIICCGTFVIWTNFLLDYLFRHVVGSSLAWFRFVQFLYFYPDFIE